MIRRVNSASRVRDSSGNVTTLSTHEGPHHVIKSYNAYTGEGRAFDIDAVGQFMQLLIDGADLNSAVLAMKANG